MNRSLIVLWNITVLFGLFVVLYAYKYFLFSIFPISFRVRTLEGLLYLTLLPSYALHLSTIYGNRNRLTLTILCITTSLSIILAICVLVASSDYWPHYACEYIIHIGPLLLLTASVLIFKKHIWQSIAYTFAITYKRLTSR